MRIFKVKTFVRFARKEDVTDASLTAAVNDAESGLIYADLGGEIIKQPVARQGHGKSGSFRTLIAYRPKRRAVFLFGFAKSDRDNVDDEVMKKVRKMAELWLDADEAALQRGMDSSLITEVKTDGKSKDKPKPQTGR